MHKKFIILFKIVFLILLLNVSKEIFAKEEKIQIALKNEIENTNDEQYKNYFKIAEENLLKYKFEESIENCENAIKYKSNDFLARALICLNYYEIAEQLNVKKKKEKEKKIEIYEKMMQIAREGIKLAPEKGECYFMLGLAKARRSTTVGILSSLFSAKEIEKLWLKSVKIKSEYISPTGEDLLASSYLALGCYYRLCPSFFLLKILFGLDGDINKSVDYCKKAMDLDGKRIEIVKEYGISLITHGLKNNNKDEIEKGKEYLRMVQTLPIRLKTDFIDIEHSSMLLNNIKLCPGYSRDQQQDISEDTYKKMQQYKQQASKD